MRRLKQLHNILIPEDIDVGYSAYINLLFLGIFFVNFYFYPFTIADIAIVSVAVTCFLVCYFTGFRQHNWRLIFYIAAICLIGSVMSTYGPGASVFFVYAGAFCCNILNSKKAFSLLAGVITYVAIFTYLGDHSAGFWMPAIFFATVIGAINIHQVEVHSKNKALKQSQQEIQQLAQTAERERISRDLHDLLGHTLSVITLKSELASKMIEKGSDIDKVKAEIKAIEQLSRDTLAQVRGAVKGYNQATLEGELLSARVATDAAHIELLDQIEPLTLSPEVENELALILREAITNVVRHAQTSKVWVTLNKQGGAIRLAIRDQGKMKQVNLQSGTENMRSRIEKVGGRMHLKTEPSTEFVFEIPYS